MATVVQSFQYTVEASYILGSEQINILSDTIQNIICKYDYESKYMPIIYMGLKLPERLYGIMLQNVDKGQLSLTVYKYIRLEGRILQKEVYFRSFFSYFIQNAITDDDKKSLNDVNETDSKSQAYKTTTLGLFDMNIVNNNGIYTNQLFRDSSILSIVHYCTSHMKMIIEPFKDQDKLDFCFLPPNLSVHKLLKYLNSVHNFYHTSYRYFNDFNRTYLLSTRGTPISASTEEYDTVIVSIMDSVEIETKYLSMEIDSTQKAYVLYIDKDFVGIDVNHLRDKQYQKIIGTDSLGNIVEKDLNIPTNENGTSKIKLERLYNGNLDHIETLSDNIENSSIMINIIKSQIDNSIITPNKEFLVRNHNDFKKYNGRYLLAYKKEIFVQQSGDFMSNTVFGLRKIMD